VSNDKRLAVSQPIDRQIHLIRGEKVMLDADLAALYNVSTKAFNQAVKRNRNRFPEDFMFQLSADEAAAIRSQFVTASKRNIRFRPHAFTEHGVAMLANLLRSKRAIQVSVMIVRAFIRLREMIAFNKELAARMEKLEAEQSQLKAGHAQHASVITVLVEEIKSMKALPVPSKKRIGFNADRS
jgi:hypothetical protein